MWDAELVRNVVTRRDLRSLTRGVTLSAVLIGWTSILGVVELVMLLAQPNLAVDQAAQLGTHLFQTLALCQLGLILLLVPPLTVFSVLQEKRSGSWDLILLTRLSSFAIVWGKLISSLAAVVLPLVASLPLLVLPLVFGGVNSRQVIQAYVVFAASTLFVVSMSLLLSVVGRRLSLCLGLSVALTLLFSAGLSALILGNGTRLVLGSLVVNPHLTRLAPFDPMAALLSTLTQPGSIPIIGQLAASPYPLGFHLSLWVLYCVISVAASSLFLLVAASLVRVRSRWPDSRRTV